MPTDLETLILEDAPHLSEIWLLARPFDHLSELSLKGCPGLAEATLHAIATTAPNLRWLDLSDCPQLRTLPRIRAPLDRLELNRCENLKILPEAWRAPFRRVGLRGANKLRGLPKLPRRVKKIMRPLGNRI